MKRFLLQDLEQWKGKPNRKPLILKGVRQTGKTYLLEQFGKRAFNDYYLINFERQESAKEIFAGDLEAKTLLTAIEFYLQKKINPQTDLLIFDEIQACPRAITSLKYFCEDMPELSLCSAGSLLGLHLNESSFPVGKIDMLNLYPMTYGEFLMGLKDEFALELISSCNPDTRFPPIAHQHCWERLKQYFITGGLPEVVSTFAAYENDLFTATQEVRNKQDILIKSYYADIAKHAGKVNAMHIARTWQSIPKQLAQSHDGGAARFRFKDIIPNIKRYSQLANVLDWLESAELTLKVPIINTIRIPLNAYTKDNIFKQFMFDVGILGAMGQLPVESILKYDYGNYKGYFAENFVAQQLIATNKNLFNWQEMNSEIEFILQKGNNTIPVEVKSGLITKAQSLKKYQDKYKPNYSFILSAKPMNINENQAFLPLYLTEYLDRFLG